MNFFKTFATFRLVFVEGMESRIQTNSTELVGWLIAGRIFSVPNLFIIVIIIILWVLLLISTTPTECEDRFLVITETPVTILLSTQEMLYKKKYELEMPLHYIGIND